VFSFFSSLDPSPVGRGDPSPYPTVLDASLAHPVYESWIRHCTTMGTFTLPYPNTIITSACNMYECHLYIAESSSTQVVDEHFERSLGSEYMRLLKHPAAPSSAPPPSSNLDTTPLSVAGSYPAGHISVNGKLACLSLCLIVRVL